MKKRLMALGMAGIMAAATILTGCSGSSGAGGAAGTNEKTAGAEKTAAAEKAGNGEKTVITFWNGFTGSDRETLEALVQKYNDTNDKNVQVDMNIMPWDSLYQK